MYLCESNDNIFFELVYIFCCVQIQFVHLWKIVQLQLQQCSTHRKTLEHLQFFEFNINDKFKLKFEKTGLDQACFSSGDRYSDKCYFKYILLSSNSRKYALF